MTGSVPPSPLELLHPDGVTGRASILGAACPGWLPPLPPDGGGEEADLVVVAPADAQARDGAWVREAARSAARSVAPDGLVYLLAPSRRRQALVRALAEAGLVREATLVHLPQLEAGRHLATADRRALRFALTSLLAPSPRRRAAALALVVPGGVLPFRLRAGAGVVLRPPGARPLLAWVAGLVPTADSSSVVLTRTWRETGGSAVVRVFERSGAGPAAVAKVRPAAGERAHADELHALEAVAPGARLAGVEAPVPLSASLVGGRPVLLASAVPGRPVHTVLAGRPERARAFLDRLADRLEEWNRATCVPDGFSAPQLEERLVEQARALGGHLPEAGAYEAWLRTLAVAVPAVAAHNDLTTANVLAGRDGRLGIVDWESARERDLPLGDLVYATVDAHFLAGRFPSRVAAFDACFGGEGEEARAARRRLARLRSALGLDATAVVACFHACWLAHAVNDLRRVPAEESEFVAIAARLARGRHELAEHLAGPARGLM